MFALALEDVPHSEAKLRQQIRIKVKEPELLCCNRADVIALEGWILYWTRFSFILCFIHLFMHLFSCFSSKKLTKEFQEGCFPIFKLQSGVLLKELMRVCKLLK